MPALHRLHATAPSPGVDVLLQALACVQPLPSDVLAVVVDAVVSRPRPAMDAVYVWTHPSADRSDPRMREHVGPWLKDALARCAGDQIITRQLLTGVPLEDVSEYVASTPTPARAAVAHLAHAALAQDLASEAFIAVQDARGRTHAQLLTLAARHLSPSGEAVSRAEDTIWLAEAVREPAVLGDLVDAVPARLRTTVASYAACARQGRDPQVVLAQNEAAAARLTAASDPSAADAAWAQAVYATGVQWVAQEAMTHAGPQVLAAVAYHRRLVDTPVGRQAAVLLAGLNAGRDLKPDVVPRNAHELAATLLEVSEPRHAVRHWAATHTDPHADLRPVWALVDKLGSVSASRPAQVAVALACRDRVGGVVWQRGIERAEQYLALRGQQSATAPSDRLDQWFHKLPEEQIALGVQLARAQQEGDLDLASVPMQHLNDLAREDLLTTWVPQQLGAQLQAQLPELADARFVRVLLDVADQQPESSVADLVQVARAVLA